MGRELKQFLSLEEAAISMGTDREGLRQALELGSLSIPGFVHSAGGKFLALLRPLEGGSYETKGLDDCFGKVHLTPELTLDAQETYPGRYSRISGSWQTQEETGYPVTFDLTGYFRVRDWELRRAAEVFTDSSSDSIRTVAPIEWWSAESPFHNPKTNAPRRCLEIVPSNLDYLARPRFTDVKFHISDIDNVRNGRVSTNTPAERVVDLRKDAKDTYAKVIAAMWLKAHGDGQPGRISSDPYSAAQSLAKVLLDLGFPKPGADKIGRILADEVSAAGIKIGTSESND